MRKWNVCLVITLVLLSFASATFAATVSYLEISQGSYDLDSTAGTMYPLPPVGSDPTLVDSKNGKEVMGTDAYYWMERKYQSSTGSVSYSNFPSGTVPSAVVVTPGHSTTFASGYSDSATRTLKGSAAVISNGARYSPYTSESISKSDLSNKFTVSAGNSSLADGDTARIKLNFRLDGFLSATGRSWPGSGHAYPEMMAGLEIRDASTRSRVVSFDANAKIDAGPVNMDYWPMSYQSDLDWAWGASTNAGVNQVQRDSNSVTSTLTDSDVTHNFSFDTGMLQLYFDVTVGNSYNLYEYLYTFSHADGIATAFSDFSSTFGPSIIDDNGTDVVIAWERGELMDAPSVPEPSTFVLLGAGLVGVVLFRKRMKR